MSNEISVKMERVSGTFNIDTDKIVCVEQSKYNSVRLCLQGNMNIPFARIQLYDSGRMVDAQATFYDAAKLGKAIETRFNAIPEVLESMRWMIQHFDWANKDTGLEQPDSPELTKAKEVFARLKGEL